jgi:hypothetical protein
MITTRLWHALSIPPMTHPLFQRLFYEQSQTTWERIRMGVWMTAGVLTLILIMAVPVIFFAVLIGGPIAYAILNTIIYCALWSMDITGTIARELSRKTYDLECMTPVGTLGIDWIIITGRLHYKDGLMRSMSEIFAVIQLLFFVVLFIVVGVLVTPPTPEQAQLFQAMIIVLSLMAFLYIDHMQTTICSVCIGLIAARQTRTVGDARLWALLCFLAMQLGWYMSVIVLSVVVMPLIVQLFQLEHLIFSLLLPVLALTLITGSHELITRWLWRLVLRGTNADHRDLILLERYAYISAR